MTTRITRQLSIHISLLLIITTALLNCFAAQSFADVSPTATGRVNAEVGAYLRKTASVSSAVVAELEDNTALTIHKEVFTSKKSRSETKRWYYVTAKGIKGYIRSDLVDGTKYKAVKGKIKSKTVYRKGAGTKMKKAGTLKKGKTIKVYLAAEPVKSTKGPSKTWYKFKKNRKWYYVPSTSVQLTAAASVPTVTTAAAATAAAKPATVTSNAMSKMTDKEFEAYLTKQGFPEGYKVKLRALHKAHPNWVFIAYHTNVNWKDALAKQTRDRVSLIHKSQPTSYRSKDKHSYRMIAGDGIEAGEIPVEVTETAAAPQPVQEQSVEEADNEQADSEQAAAETPEQPADQVAAEPQSEPAAEEGDSAAPEAAATAAYSSVAAVASADTLIYAVPDEDFPEVGCIIKDSEVTVTGKISFAEEDEPETLWYQLIVSMEGEQGAGSCIVYAHADTLAVNGELSETDLPAEVMSILEEGDADARPVSADVLQSGQTDTNADPQEDSQTESGEVMQETSQEETAPVEEDNDADEPENDANSDAAPEAGDAGSSEEVVDSASHELDTATRSAANGYISKEPGWYNASSQVVAYYMDPRNFLNQDRIYMFEDLSYRPEYQTAAVVTKILAPSKLPKYGFTSKLFMAAGKANKVSPVFLAARARQETGGGSITINGSKYGGTVVYNPFNVGATGSDPATNGLRYAKSKGWTTQAKAVNGGAAYIASGYITKKQNSIYFQRFNVCNGLSNVGVHQYMTNIQAPYNEAYMTKTSYTQLGITNESLAFIIPIYKGMPSSTKLP